MVQKPQFAIKMLSGSVSVISAAPDTSTLDAQAKLYSKTLYYDVTPFMYYVMVSNLCGFMSLYYLQSPTSRRPSGTPLAVISSAISPRRRNPQKTTMLPAY